MEPKNKFKSTTNPNDNPNSTQMDDDQAERLQQAFDERAERRRQEWERRMEKWVNTPAGY